MSIVAIAADHRGYRLKSVLKAELEAEGHDVVDLGTESAEPVDYPDFADKLAREIEQGHAARGVLICGSGIGMSIAANRHRQIRAALCQNAETARLTRQHNDANVLVLAGATIAEPEARACLHVFMNTPFESGRHARRIAKLA